jgi:hypothetical protein
MAGGIGFPRPTRARRRHRQHLTVDAHCAEEHPPGSWVPGGCSGVEVSAAAASPGHGHVHRPQIGPDRRRRRHGGAYPPPAIGRGWWVLSFAAYHAPMAKRQSSARDTSETRRVRTRVPRGERPARGWSLAGSHLQVTGAANEVKSAGLRMIVGVSSPEPPRFACPTWKADTPHTRRVSYRWATVVAWTCSWCGQINPNLVPKPPIGSERVLRQTRHVSATGRSTKPAQRAACRSGTPRSTVSRSVGGRCGLLVPDDEDPVTFSERTPGRRRV